MAKKLSAEVVAAGDVEVGKSIKIQLVEFHPVEISVAVRVPIEEGETAAQALRRVRKIVEEEADAAVEQVYTDGMKWGKKKSS